ncbi:hypothetical protein LZ518_01790 [Sphingomonas sp. RB56-2]|uniref:Uncharacterized protein n=1 Tax=Sphingomonas brevis TaxID=2908206 RepID=A0ABT0S651_9SPHN|nr:hypothetical protein [Sphingomonas brevis]MCL6739871.1 hypothetical protein [Sphingomonas brevis]
MRWLQGPPLTGRLALLCGIAATSAATATRFAIDDMVVGCEFTIFLPFVLLAALLLRWWLASLVALACALFFGFIFVGTPSAMLASHCFLPSSAMFLLASGTMIGFVMVARALFHAMHVPGEDESPGGIIFSLEDDKVWATWYGQGSPVLLGSASKVSSMMEDFLAQLAVGKRLNGNH